MKILVFPDEYEVSDEMIDNCQCYLITSKDKKSFTVERQPALSNTRLFMKHLGYKRNMGDLKSVILAERKK